MTKRLVALFGAAVIVLAACQPGSPSTGPGGESGAPASGGAGETGGSTDLAVWAAVDFDTGELSVATPSGALGSIDFRGHHMKVNSAGQLRRLESENMETLEILLVRPREGAWTLRGSDGGKADSDGQHNQKFELDVESLQALPGFGPPPKHFAKGDVIVIIDPISGAAFATTVGK